MFRSAVPVLTVALISLFNSFIASDCHRLLQLASNHNKFENGHTTLPMESYPNKFNMQLLQSALFCNPRRSMSRHAHSHNNHNAVLVYLSILLKCQSSDVEVNPGPPKFPCGECLTACTWNPKKPVIACDTCDTWYHKDCIGLTSAIFDCLSKPEASWICCSCGVPNFSSSLFASFEINCDNSFEILANQTLNATTNSESSIIGPPLQCSSPLPEKRKHTKKNNMRVLVVNCQSIMSKKESLWETIDTSHPDLSSASETWLKNNVSNSEL